jgi:hypothetical protein
MQIHSDNIYGWEGLRLTAGDVSLGLTPSVGGRIMSLAVGDRELFYVQEDLKGLTCDFSGVGDIVSHKKDFGFRFWGGDKTWVAPERAWQNGIPPLELDAGNYSCEISDQGVVMTSPVCRETGLQIVRRVSLSEKGEIFLKEELHNKGSSALERGIWNVTQVRRPFQVFLPAALADLRSYHLEDPTLPDPLFELQAQKGWVRIPCTGDVCFKFGGMLREAKVVALKPFHDGCCLFSRSFDRHEGALYAHRSQVEVFNSSTFPYGEVEVHSPLVSIPPGGSRAMSQVWKVRFCTFFNSDHIDI